MADDSPDKPQPQDAPEDIEEAGDEEAFADEPFTSADFHTIVQKQVAHAATEMLAQGKMPWEFVAPFLEAARDLMADDLREAGQVRLHTVQAEGDAWVDAEEAFLGIEIHDRDTRELWLSETFWLSDIATAEADPEEVRAIVRALERTIAKLNTWLAEQAEGGGKAD